MPAPSAFQTLPLLVMDKIIEYLVGRFRYSARSETDLNIYNHAVAKASLYPLLYVGESWRVAAFSLICDSCEINFDSSPEGYRVTYPAVPRGPYFPQYRREKLVRRVVIKVPSWSDICSEVLGSIPSWLTLELPVFPLAVTLVVCLGDDEMGLQTFDVNTSGTRKNMSADKKRARSDFARLLRQLTPAATGLVALFRRASSVDETSVELCKVLVSELCCGRITNLGVESIKRFPLTFIESHGVSGLTSITQGQGMECLPFARIACLSAGTLQELSLRPKTATDWHALVLGDAGASVVFSDLTTLLLDTDGLPDDVFWTVIKDVAPFPVLTRISISGAYPFSDDLLFRGNSGTLRDLSLPFNMVYRKIPGHFGVFELSGVTRMNSISIGSMEVGNEGRHAPGTAVSFIDKQVHRVVEVATVLRLGDGTPTRQLYNAILTAPRTLTVQHLDFRGFPFAAKNAVEIIAALPNLVSLTCRIEETRSTIDEMPEDEYPSALLERYGNLNNSFRKLVLVNVVDEEYDYESMDDVLTGEIAIVVVQIAVLCPNLTHVDIPEEMHSVFGREIAWAMLNHPFSPYADSLRRLLYIK